MERTPPFVTNRIGPVLQEAVVIAAGIWVVLAMDPWVERNLPNLDVGWRYALSAIAVAVIAQALIQLFFGWPRLTIHWELKGESAPISSIVARGTARRPDSQPFVVTVLIPPGGWIGSLAMKLITRCNVTLQIRIERAAVVPIVERSSMVGSKPTVVPDPNTNGFIVNLGKAPLRPGKWHWATVRWETSQATPGAEVNVDCVLHHENRAMRTLLGLVQKKTNVNQFHVERP